MLVLRVTPKITNTLSPFHDRNRIVSLASQLSDRIFCKEFFLDVVMLSQLCPTKYALLLGQRLRHYLYEGHALNDLLLF